MIILVLVDIYELAPWFLFTLSLRPSEDELTPLPESPPAELRLDVARPIAKLESYPELVRPVDPFLRLPLAPVPPVAAVLWEGVFFFE